MKLLDVLGFVAAMAGTTIGLLVLMAALAWRDRGPWFVFPLRHRIGPPADNRRAALDALYLSLAITTVLSLVVLALAYIMEH